MTTSLKNNLKAFTIVLSMPVLLTIMFQSNQIKTEINRSPAVEKTIKVKTVKSEVKAYLLAVNGIN